MKIEAAKSVDEVLTVLAERFGSTAEHLWGVMVAYHLTCAWVLLVTGMILLVVGVRVTVLIARFYRSEKYNYNQHDVGVAMGFLATGLTVTTGFLFVTINVITVLNPEYAALKDVLGAF